MPMSHRLMAVVFVVAAVQAQSGSGSKSSSVDAAVRVQAVSPLVILRRASAEQRPKALVAFLEDQLSTNALYAGQYVGLRKVDGIGSLLQAWVSKAPAGVADPIILRRACIRALRDLHDNDAPKKLVKTLQSIAVDEKADRRLVDASRYALAQFGFREFVGQMMIKFYTMVASKDPSEQAKGFSGLARVLYQIRDYKKAVGAYTGYLELFESGDTQIKNPQTVYYNTACCMALSGMIDESLETLAKALKSGISLGRRMLEEDRDIRALRKDPRFAKLIEDYFGKRK